MMTSLRKFTRAWLLLLVFVAVSGCALLEEVAQPRTPELQVVGQRLVGLSLEQVELEMDFAIFNPNAFSIPVGALDYQLDIQGQQLLRGQQRQGFNLRSGEKAEVTLPITLEFSQLAALVGNLAGTHELAYRFAGGMSFDLPLLGSQRAPIETRGSFPVPALPEIQVAGLKAQELSLASAGLLLELKLTNPNVFDLNMTRFDYGLNLEGNQVVGGGLASGLHLPAGEEVTLALPFSVRLLDLGRSGFAALTQAAEINYSLNFSSGFASGLEALGSLEYASEQQGKIRLQR